MPCREIIAVGSQIHTKHTNTLCGQNVELTLSSVRQKKPYIKSRQIQRWNCATEWRRGVCKRRSDIPIVLFGRWHTDRAVGDIRQHIVTGFRFALQRICSWNCERKMVTICTTRFTIKQLDGVLHTQCINVLCMTWEQTVLRRRSVYYSQCSAGGAKWILKYVDKF